MTGGERYWIGVASRDHVLRGVEGGFAQLSHGKRAPLALMGAGDWLVYYSPRDIMNGGEPLQAFIAIGRVSVKEAYHFDMGGGFVPFRRSVGYLFSEETPIRSLIDRLSFIKDKKRWGQPFRKGHFEIIGNGLSLIASAMSVDPLGEGSRYLMRDQAVG